MGRRHIAGLGKPVDVDTFTALAKRADELHTKLGYAYQAKRNTGWLNDRAMKYVGDLESEFDGALDRIFSLIEDVLETWIWFHSFDGSLENILDVAGSDEDAGAEYWYEQFAEWVGGQPRLDTIVHVVSKRRYHGTHPYEVFEYAFKQDRALFTKIYKLVYPHFISHRDGLKRAFANVQSILGEMKSPPSDLMDKGALYQKMMNLMHSSGSMFEHVFDDDSMAKKVLDDLASYRYLNHDVWKKEVENKLGSKVAYLVLAINVLGEI